MAVIDCDRIVRALGQSKLSNNLRSVGGMVYRMLPTFTLNSGTDASILLNSSQIFQSRGYK